MKVTTYGLLSFEDCEFTLRPESASYHLSGDGQKYCSVLLSEIPLQSDFVLGKFEIIPLSRKQFAPFMPYALVVNLPDSIDFLNAPLAGEAIAAMLSFCLRRRVKAHRRPFGHEIQDEGQLGPEVFSSLPVVLVGPEMLLSQPLPLEDQKRRMTLAETVYNIITRMNTPDYLATIRAIHLYQLALLTLRDDIGLAYTMLVASAETMAQQFIRKEDAPRDQFLESLSWNTLLNHEGIQGRAAEKILAKVLEREEFLGFRFRKFIEQNLPDSFWTSPDSRAKELDEYIEDLRKTHFGEEYIRKRGDHFSRWWWLYQPDVRISKEELDDVLRDVYKLRSKFAHVGVSPPAEVAEIYEIAKTNANLVMSNTRQRIEFVRSPPSFFWFERVVNESITNFVLKIQNQGGT
jgi:hypothetical protein